MIRTCHEKRRILCGKKTDGDTDRCAGEDNESNTEEEEAGQHRPWLDKKIYTNLSNIIFSSLFNIFILLYYRKWLVSTSLCLSQGKRERDDHQIFQILIRMPFSRQKEEDDRQIIPILIQMCQRLQLIKVDQMRVKLNKSWNSISVAMGKMFHFPQNRFRHMIENTVAQLGKLDLTSELVPAFLKETIDLSSVGPWCDALRITRRQLLDWTLIENDSLCASLQNGLLLELDRFRSVEKLQPGHLVDWVKGLSNMDVAPLERELVSTLKQIKTEYQALNKSKTMNREKIEMFLKEQFTISVAVATPVAAEGGLSQCASTTDSNTLADDHVHAMPDLQEQVDSDDQNALKHSQTLGMMNKKLTGDLALRDAEIAALNLFNPDFLRA